MKFNVVLAGLLAGFVGVTSAAEDQTSVLVLVGAGGTPEYAEGFARAAAELQSAAASGGARALVIGTEKSDADNLEEFRRALVAESVSGSAELWLVLIGHGTFDGKEAKFNLRGDDLSATEFARLLQPFQRPLVLVNAFSASGGFLAPLSAPGRVVITATKSGSEQNFSRFADLFSKAITDPVADLDRDGQVSVFEAWLTASQRVQAFYEADGRLATEHSLLDDNGDALGTPADWFEGVRAVKRAKSGAAPDGLRAQQIHLIPNAAERALSAEIRAERDALELELAKLREAKATMSEAQYFSDLEKLLRRIARLYQSAPAPD